VFTFRGAGREGVQLLGDAVDVVEGVRRDRRADQHEVGAEGLHDVELALGAAQVGRQPLGRGAVEVAEGLVEVDRQAEVGAAGADLLRRVGRGDEVGLEDLDAVEARGGGRDELVLERPGQADGGHGGAHPASVRDGRGRPEGLPGQWVTTSPGAWPRRA
jgi:hypothetical protein